MVAAVHLNVANFASLSRNMRFCYQVYPVSRGIFGVGLQRVNNIPCPCVNCAIIADTMVKVNHRIGVIIGEDKADAVIVATLQGFEGLIQCSPTFRIGRVCKPVEARAVGRFFWLAVGLLMLPGHKLWVVDKLGKKSLAKLLPQFLCVYCIVFCFVPLIFSVHRILKKNTRGVCLVCSGSHCYYSTSFYKKMACGKLDVALCDKS